MPLTLDEMAATKKAPTLDEMAAPERIGIAPPISEEKMMYFEAAKPTFWQKWKRYFGRKEYVGRWTKPTRYEKFYNITTQPLESGTKILGSTVSRINKFVTEVSPWPETMRTVATQDPWALKEIPLSLWDAKRVFYPVPGAADELKTMGDAMAKDWHIPLTGEEPPWWYVPTMDIAFETLLFSASAAQRASRARMNPKFGNAKLTSTEIKAAKHIYSAKHLAKMQPAQVRATLAKESAVIALSKAQKAQLLKRGFKPIQIQRMTPLDAYQIIDDVPMAESAANVTFKSSMWISKSYKHKNIIYYPIKSQASKLDAAIDKNRIGWITNLETKAGLRRKGEATKLIDRALQFLKSEGVTEVRAIPETTTSKTLFIKLGFKQSGRMFIRDISKVTAKTIPREKIRNLASATRVAVDRLTAGIKRAKKLHPKKEKMITQEKARRVAVAEQIRRAKTGEAAALATRGPLKGEYPIPAFTAPDISSADRYYLFESLRTSKMSHFRYRNTADALLKLVRGEMPTRGETALLQRHFGSGLAKAILQKRAFGTKAWQSTIDALNIPRATLASFDLSFPLRQGIILLPGHPKQWAKSFGQMIKAGRPGAKGKRYARHLEDIAESSRYATLRRNAKLDITEWGLAGISAREEPFLSSWAELIPGVKWAERTFTTMSNQLRINVFDDIARNWESAGMSWSSHPEEYTRLAAFLNHATGRGTIPARYAKITPELNATFFSPRFQISRPQVVYDAFVSLKNPAARKVIIGDTVKFVGTGTATLWLLSQIEGVEVELDPRSSDFGKVRYGDTRYDFWAGYSQIARLIAQAAAAQQKATGTDQLYNISPAEVINRYVRTKLSPPAGLTWDVLTGQTFLGEEMVFEETFIGKEALKRTVPMVMQDIYDAIRFQGLDGALPITSTTAFFGVSVGTWEPSGWTILSRTQDELAMSTYGKEWEQLNEIEQKLLTRDNVLLENLKREAEYDRTVFPFLEEIKQEQLVAGLDIEGNLSKEVQTEMQRLKIRVGPIPRSFGTWTLNNERYENYKDYIKEELENVLSPVFKKESWSKRPKKQQIAFIENAIEIARERARTRVRIEARKD